jgi:hypothetical protein
MGMGLRTFKVSYHLWPGALGPAFMAPGASPPGAVRVGKGTTDKVKVMEMRIAKCGKCKRDIVNPRPSNWKNGTCYCNKCRGDWYADLKLLLDEPDDDPNEVFTNDSPWGE